MREAAVAKPDKGSRVAGPTRDGIVSLLPAPQPSTAAAGLELGGNTVLDAQRPVRRRWLRTLAVLTTLGIAVAACGGGSSTKTTSNQGQPKAQNEGKATPGGSVTYFLEAETSGGFCPPNAQLVISGIMVAQALFDTLTAPNTKGEYVPYLAKSVTPSADFKTWTIGLRDGVKFQNGQAADAAAIAQNITAWTNGQLLGFAFSNIATVTATNPTTVTVTMKVPWPSFAGYLYLDGRAAVAAPAQLDNAETCPTNPIGTGPFKLKEWKQNDHLTAVKNPDYWQKDKTGVQLPYLDQITFRPVPEPSQRVNNFSAGQDTMIHMDYPKQQEQLRALGTSQATLYTEGDGRREVRYYLLNAAAAPFDDLNARKAFAMAVDRDALIKINELGLFDKADQPFDKDTIGYLKNPGFPQHNLAEAKKLVTAYKDAHGGKFDIAIECTADDENVHEAETIKRQAEAAGIHADIKNEDQASFVNAALGGNFDVLLWRNHPGDTPDVEYFWWYTGSPINFGKFTDPQMQKLLDQGRAATTDAARKPIYEAVSRRFASQVYNLWGYYIRWVIAAKPDVKGVLGPPLPDNGGQPQYLYGRLPVVGLWIKK
jgi:peptide/nickel transport system substrate-binding protein